MPCRQIANCLHDRSYNALNEFALTNVNVLYISTVVPTGAPLQLTAPQVTTNSLTLSWDPPQFDRQNGLIRHYVIYITDFRSGASWEVNVNDTRALIPNLQPFVTYNCSVAAVTIGVGPISESFVIRLPQDGKYVKNVFSSGGTEIFFMSMHTDFSTVHF